MQIRIFPRRILYVYKESCLLSIVLMLDRVRFYRRVFFFHHEINDKELREVVLPLCNFLYYPRDGGYSKVSSSYHALDRYPIGLENSHQLITIHTCTDAQNRYQNDFQDLHGANRKYHLKLLICYF